jgi:hypothetical protein
MGVTCFDTGRCIKGNFGDVAYWWVPAIGWAIWIDNMSAAQPTPSIPTRIDENPVKVLPYAFASPLLKMDQVGPTASAGTLGSATTPCTLQMGTTYKDFLAQCVKVTGDSAKDQIEVNKLLGGLSHGTETYHFDVTGVDVNFTAKTLAADDIVHDNSLPADDDVAESFDIDQETLGALANDYDMTQNPPVRDLHGAGAVYKEYARLVRAQLLAQAGIPDNPNNLDRCLFPRNANDPNSGFDAAAQADFMARLPRYCTGFEGMITAAPATCTGGGGGPGCGNGFANDPVNLGLNALKVTPGYKLGMKLGHQQGTFCMDATGDLTTGYQHCNSGDLMSTSFAQVLAVFGKGKLSRLPTEVQDVRFFFKQYMKAIVEYFMTGDDRTMIYDIPNATWTDANGVKQPIAADPDDLFFDSIGAGQFEIAEYIDRRFASKTQHPTDFVFSADVKNGIMDEYSFSRALLRGETAIYTAMLEDPNDGLGQEHHATLTNIFGSPVLAAGWMPSSAGKSAYYCATADPPDPTNCDGQMPPMAPGGQDILRDELGRPILEPYPGAFNGTQTVFDLGQVNIKVKQTYNNIQQAMVQIPTFSNPYDPNSNSGPSLMTLIPWAPKQPGIGFPVALSGTLDKFIETAQLDFSGEEITANIDYDVVVDPNTHLPLPNGTIQFLAVETTDFLGDVFLCQDANTGDLLTARMYTPVANILQWLQDHPGSYQSCGIIIRYSPFGNYADYITALNAGVRLGVTQGGGFGRVVDATLFVPGQ